MKRLLILTALFLTFVGLRINSRIVSSTSFTPKSWIIQSAVDDHSPPKRGVGSSNNQSYFWYGNHWMPPRGVPMYTREDMIHAFSHFDTLWIGDSTTRRSFATMSALMKSNSTSISVNNLDHPRVIDVNRYRQKGYRENSCWRQRKMAESYRKPGILDIWGPRSICRTVGNRAFDYIRLECFKDLARLAELDWEMKQYSLIIIGMGIFDILVDTCGSYSPNLLDPYETLDMSANLALQAAQQMASKMKTTHADDHHASSTAVLWRTTGFDSNNTQSSYNATFHLNQLSINFIPQNELSSNGTLKLVDWGTAVWPRSYHPHKVEADISAHYGLEARLLMAQMTTQQVMNILEE